MNPITFQRSSVAAFKRSPAGTRNFFRPPCPVTRWRGIFSARPYWGFRWGWDVSQGTVWNFDLDIWEAASLAHSVDGSEYSFLNQTQTQRLVDTFSYNGRITSTLWDAYKDWTEWDNGAVPAIPELVGFRPTVNYVVISADSGEDPEVGLERPHGETESTPTLSLGQFLIEWKTTLDGTQWYDGVFSGGSRSYTYEGDQYTYEDAVQLALQDLARYDLDSIGPYTDCQGRVFRFDYSTVVFSSLKKYNPNQASPGTYSAEGTFAQTLTPGQSYMYIPGENDTGITDHDGFSSGYGSNVWDENTNAIRGDAVLDFGTHGTNTFVTLHGTPNMPVTAYIGFQVRYYFASYKFHGVDDYVIDSAPYQPFFVGSTRMLAIRGAAGNGTFERAEVLKSSVQVATGDPLGDVSIFSVDPTGGEVDNSDGNGFRVFMPSPAPGEHTFDPSSIVAQGHYGPYGQVYCA